MHCSLLRTEILCPDLWREDLKISLPYMPEGRVLYLHFTLPTKARIEGLFVVERRLDMYDTSEGGYIQRLRLRIYNEEQDPLNTGRPEEGEER